MSTKDTNNKSKKVAIRFEHELIDLIESHKDELIPFSAWVKAACREKMEREKSYLVTTPEPKLPPISPPSNKSSQKPTPSKSGKKTNT